MANDSSLISGKSEDPESKRPVKSAYANKKKELSSKVSRPRAHKILGLSHKEWVAEGKPKVHKGIDY